MQIQGYPLFATERGQFLFEAEVTLDSSGGGTTALGQHASKLFESITRDAAGKYTLTLKKRWARLVPVGCNLLGEAAELSKIFAVTDGSAADNTIEVGVFTDGGTLAFADPAAARTCHITLILQNSKRRV